ncbi:probable peroxisomal targeting signal 1 receptor [Coccomyxa sp. Obi]|nr:probable peroxisomal targeting signal 1 receptor [Coccomyxa sp. Obi]
MASQIGKNPHTNLHYAGSIVDLVLPGNNPLAKRFSGLLDSTQKNEQIPRLPDMHITSIDREKIASRASVVTRHVFPDSSKEFQAEQVQSFLRSLDKGEGPSWQDDRKYEEFIRPPQPQGPQHQAWVDEFGRLPAAGAAAPFPSNGHAAGPSAQWATEYQRQNGPMSAWAEEYGAGPSQGQMSNLSLRDNLRNNGHATSAWATEYLGGAGLAASPSGLDSQWAEQYTNARPQSERWADEYATSSGQDPHASLTPEQQKAMRGPSAEDPLEDESAASWVQQFNEELTRPSINALEFDMSELEASCGMMPAQDNPYSAHAMPLQIAQQMEREGRLRAASLAYEAAVRVVPMNREAWWRLGGCRLELEDFRGACGPLTHVLKGWPTHPANGAAWRALVQAALAAGKKEVASEALQGWLQSTSGSADAALSLGAGGRVNTSHLEHELARRAEVTPGEVLTWELLGYLHSIRGDHAAATEAFGKAVVTGAGQDNNALCLLGSSLAQQKQHSQAERVFKAASASPEYTRAWAGLARCQSAQGRFAEAVQSYSRALERRPDSTSLWDSLAMALTALGRMDRADAAARQDPTVLQQTSVAAV